MLVFDLDRAMSEETLGARLARSLGSVIAPHEVREFADGEFKIRPLVDPRGSHVVVCASLFGDTSLRPAERLVRLAWFIATVRQHGAAQVTAVVPYLAFARKERVTQPWDPIASRYVAQCLEAAGMDQIMVLEAHSPAAYYNAFRKPACHFAAHSLFDDALTPWLAHPWVVVAPDPGGVKRAQLWREHLVARFHRPVGFAMIDKRRSAGVVRSEGWVSGVVAEATALLIDDLIATGHTLVHAASALRNAGAQNVLACAAHGLFVGSACDVLAGSEIAAVVVSDSVPIGRVPNVSALAKKLRVVSAAPLLASMLAQSDA